MVRRAKAVLEFYDTHQEIVWETVGQFDSDVLKSPFASSLRVTDRRPLRHVEVWAIESKRLRGAYFGLYVAQIGLSSSSL